MKYWRGYLTAAILCVITVGFMQLADRYTALVDMAYPYLTRTLQNFLAEWTAPLDFALWQVLLVLALLVLMTTVVLMIVLKWNFVRWLGWVLAAVSMVWLLHTGVYGLNQFAGPLADDLRMDMAEFSGQDLEDATLYFRDQANAMALEMGRDENGNLRYDSFAQLSEQAGTGYANLVENVYYSVFAGSTVGVKELAWADLYSAMGVTNVFFALTGEVTVNPNLPAVALPYTMCHGIAHRMSISSDTDAEFAAFLACYANESAQFRYSAYFMAYRYCIQAMELAGSAEIAAAAARIKTGVNAYLQSDLKAYDAYFGNHYDKTAGNLFDTATEYYFSVTGGELKDEEEVAVLLVNWYIQEQVLPYLDQEEITGFDPMDKDQVDISDIVK